MPKIVTTPPIAPAMTTTKSVDRCRLMSTLPLTAALVLVVLLVSIFTILNCYELGLMKGREQLLAKKVLELETRLTEQTEIAAISTPTPATIAPEGKLLATSTDGLFVIKGDSGCYDGFALSEPKTTKDNPTTFYDVTEKGQKIAVALSIPRDRWSGRGFMGDGNQMHEMSGIVTDTHGVAFDSWNVPVTMTDYAGRFQIADGCSVWLASR